MKDCAEPSRSRGLCAKHYRRWQRHGDPNTVKYAPAYAVEGMEYKQAEARRDWINFYKLEHGCADCGFNKHPAALDFDHRPGTIKFFNIKHGYGYGWSRLMDEVAKCEVVCANCHRIRTVKRREGGEIPVLSTGASNA
jgi:hypothetical protein